MLLYLSLLILPLIGASAPPMHDIPDVCAVNMLDFKNASAIFTLNGSEQLYSRNATVYNQLEALELKAFCGSVSPGSYCYKSNVTMLLADQIANTPGVAIPKFPIPANSRQYGGFGIAYSQCAPVVVVKCPEGIIERCRESYVCFDPLAMENNSMPATESYMYSATESAIFPTSQGVEINHKDENNDEADNAYDQNLYNLQQQPAQQSPSGGQAQCRLWLEAAFSSLESGPTRTLAAPIPMTVGISNYPAQSTMATIRVATLTITPYGAPSNAPFYVECTVANITALPILPTDQPDLNTVSMAEISDTLASVTLTTPLRVCWNSNLPVYIMPTPCPGGPFPPGLLKRYSAVCTPTVPSTTSLLPLTGIIPDGSRYSWKSPLIAYSSSMWCPSSQITSSMTSMSYMFSDIWNGYNSCNTSGCFSSATTTVNSMFTTNTTSMSDYYGSATLVASITSSYD